MNGRYGALVMAALVAFVVAAQPASAVLIYSEGFNGALGTQPAGWAAYTSGAGIVSRNDGSSSGAYEQRRNSTNTTAIGWYDQPDITDPGAWRDTTMDILMRYSGGANNDNGVIFRANDIASASSGDFYHIRVFDNQTLRLYRVRGGSFAQLDISDGGPSLSAIKDRLLRVQVYNIPDAETDNVRIVADYFDGTTDASAVVRHLEFTDDTTSAITSPGSVGVRSYIQVDNVRAVFNSLSVNNDNRYLLWYDDYYDNSGDRTSTHSAGAITQDMANRAARFINIGNGALGLRLLDFDAETSQTEWRDVKVSALMRWNTMGDDNGRIDSGLVLRETGVVGAYTGSYYHYRLVRDEAGTDQAFAQLYRMNNGTATLLDQVTLSMANVPESVNIFLQFSGIGAHLTGMASLSADFSSPFGIIDYLDASPDVINTPGSVGYRVYGSDGLTAGAVNFDNLEVTHLIPEPATLALLGLGGLSLLRRRRRKAARKALAMFLAVALLLSAGNAHATLVAYDGFADGGGSPGPGQYLT
ncbi:PEP-CTERM sorting domain-containing protein, partial [bacterium]|nr:PEP-CTERM sorting domain-containing protein [bacterium]